MLDYAEYIVSTFPETKEAYPEVFQGFDYETLKKLVNRQMFLDLFGDDPRIRYGLPLVLVHNDCYKSNMMFERGQDTEYGDRLVALLDWQAAYQGCGVTDIAKMAIMVLSTETRRAWTDWMLGRYTELFNAKVNDSKNRITLENVRKAFDEIFAYYGLMWSGTFMALVSYADRQVKNITTAEERAMMKERMASYHIDNFNDARKFFHV